MLSCSGSVCPVLGAAGGGCDGALLMQILLQAGGGELNL